MDISGPVPMPKDANLDLIRIEMLNHGAEYTWLDVLCLWQEGGKNEHLRMDEWKLTCLRLDGCIAGLTKWCATSMDWVGHCI